RGWGRAEGGREQLGQVGGGAECVAAECDSIVGRIRRRLDGFGGQAGAGEAVFGPGRSGRDGCRTGDGDAAVTARVVGVEGGGDRHTDHGVPGGGGAGLWGGGGGPGARPRRGGGGPPV